MRAGLADTTPGVGDSLHRQSAPLHGGGGIMQGDFQAIAKIVEWIMRSRSSPDNFRCGDKIGLTRVEVPLTNGSSRYEWKPFFEKGKGNNDTQSH